MPDVPPIRPAPPPASGPPTGGGETGDDSALPFALGQRVFARVVQMIASDRALLDIGGQRFTASTPVPVAPGQILQVAVRGLGPVVDLELLDPPEAVSERAYALATVIEARQTSASAPRPSADAIRALIEALPRLLGATPHDPQRTEQATRAASALLPLPLTTDGDALAMALRHAVRASGLFYEGRVASSATERIAADAGRVADDVKALLAALAPATSGSPALESTRAALAAEILARQVDVAYHKVKDGELRLDIPVMAGETPVDVGLRVREDRDASRDAEAPGGRQVELALELPSFGRVHAAIRWTPGALQTRFAVGDDAQAEILRAGLDAFAARLRAVSFRHVSVRVDVDPDALTPPADPPDPVLPGGSILHVRV